MILSIDQNSHTQSKVISRKKFEFISFLDTYDSARSEFGDDGGARDALG